MIRRRAATVALVLLAACAAPKPVSDADARVRKAQVELERSPRLYPVWAELGEARLDQARVTRDPECVRLSREAFERSLEIQPNFVALRGMTALANFRHRFDEALSWGERASAAYPEDSSVLGMLVEAWIASGRREDARERLARDTLRAADFHARAARGRLAFADGRVEEAAAEYLAAAELARDKAPRLEQWACVRAAAVFIDTDDPQRGLEILERVLPLDPDGVDVNVHMGEVEEALGEPRAALERCERVLANADDATVHAAAARIARSVGDSERAERHYVAARAVFQRAIDAGEFYTLGALARLYADAGVELDEAAKLARAHAEIVRDAESLELVERIEQQRARVDPSRGARDRAR